MGAIHLTDEVLRGLLGRAAQASALDPDSTINVDATQLMWALQELIDIRTANVMNTAALADHAEGIRGELRRIADAIEGSRRNDGTITVDVLR